MGELAPGFSKFNVNAAIRNVDHQFYIGWVQRDKNGIVLRWRTRIFAGCHSPNATEAMGLKEVFSWIINSEVTKAAIEMDAKMMVDAVSGQFNDVSEFGIVISDCIYLLNMGSDLSLSFVKRTVNGVAYALAKTTHLHASLCIWHGTLSFLEMPLAVDINSQ